MALSGRTLAGSLPRYEMKGQLVRKAYEEKSGVSVTWQFAEKL
jgi:hypothetical protein